MLKCSFFYPFSAISGVPGTGKTATVKEVIRTLKEQVMEEDLDDFDFVEINGMR